MFFTQGIWPWVLFNAFVMVLLALDLGVFHRRSRTVSTREALIWSAIWIGLALAFNLGIYIFQGPDLALQFLTGYLIEKSLSVDNIFVFVLLFTYFAVAPRHQHRLLFWGVLGALIMRGLLIGVGTVLLETFHWIIYLFGAFLVFTGIRMGLQKDEAVHPERNPVLKLLRRILPVSQDYDEGRFFTRHNGRLLATPLLLVLIVVETTDLVFAVDSIPAIFAVTNDPFIVYTSNVFAILGLRSLYFVFANVIHKFYYLKAGLAVILTYVGVKMLLADIFHIPTALSLLVIAIVLALAIVASVLRARKRGETGNKQKEHAASR